MAKTKIENVKVHNILLDGTEVETLKGHKINFDDFPEVKQAIINLYERKLRQLEGIE